MKMLSLSSDLNRSGEDSVEICSLWEGKPEFSCSQDSSHAGGEFKRDSARPPHPVSSLLCKKKHRQRPCHECPWTWSRGWAERWRWLLSWYLSSILTRLVNGAKETVDCASKSISGLNQNQQAEEMGNMELWERVTLAQGENMLQGEM